ncbi:TOBE domain-containing protein [Muriicola marianensis]|uniref:Mop domain-containing protein n=1 Tax=Muriicola marianensis TaxID=1324801 RepID=A0ABQ1QT19_9FLAO|nr:TOBE domain-containing protein [Muriicola marianensis]GGD43487.1 hypothetical protein GCM10011361_08070 [Muriicola marianensis]
MNRFEGHISEIETDGGLSLVTVRTAKDLVFRCIIIDTPASAPYLERDRKVEVLFKETEVVIGLQNTENISLSNRIPCSVEFVDKTTLLSSLDLNCAEGRIRSVISTRSVEELGLVPGKSVMALIKLNEVMLAPL